MAALPRLRFQGKVLLPVMSIMAVLVVVPMWVINRRMSRQLEINAASNLKAADAVFRNLQSLHNKILGVPFENLSNEPRWLAILKRMDRNTIEVLLKDYLDETGGQIAVYSDAQGKTVAQFSRGSADLDQFRERSGEWLERSLGRGEPATGTVVLASHLYNVFSVPVQQNGEAFGALTFGVEMGEKVVQEFKRITRSEIVLLAGDQIATATLPGGPWSSELIGMLRPNLEIAATSSPERRSLPDRIQINGEHFMFRAGRLSDLASGPVPQFILLSSYEGPLRALQATQRTFVWIQLAGILLGGGLVWFHVRQVTSPLRQLRDHVEAVGRGDFSRRVRIQSGDECGELAAVFNHMTENLQASRRELEKTVETLKTTQAQLVQSEKLRAMGTLAGGIAHDFNNILGAILGFGELALDDVPAESQVARNLKQVIKAGQRAKDLVRQILAFSRRDQPQRVTVRLHSIVDETLKLLRATIPTTVEIRYQNRARTDTVVADSSQLHQVLMNLGTNASHAMRNSGGSLSVTLDEFTAPDRATADVPQLSPGPYLRLTITDTGHGMSREIMERIFEPFFTTKPVGEGTGLGLSVVHGIVKSHGGDITVQSQPGCGTTFCIFLPRSTGPDASSSTAAPLIAGRAERILVIDDEEPLVNVMRQRLIRLGYDVVAHTNSMAAWDQLQREAPSFDLVITDQTMPHMTGEDLAREIVELRPDLPIILCTGSGHAVREPLAELGIRERLSKPVDFAELSRTIRQVLDSKPVAKEISNTVPVSV
jgi:signal transduction histidine kinase/ActR/RegA family two-component response regulator